MKSFVNRKAAHDYFFVEEFEAGIILKGTEIKSIRQGRINFKDAYARVIDKELWLFNLHISPFEKTTFFNHEPERKRKLLMKKQEINRLQRKVDEQGMTLVPKNMYLNDKGLCKVTLCLAKGKKTYDKRETLHRKEQEQEMKRRMKESGY